jgi:integrase
MARKKRGNSEGSIYQMKDGRWRAALMIGWKFDDAGKRTRDRVIFTAATRHEVASQLTEVIRDRGRGINPKPRKQTFGDFLQAWLENTVKPSVRPKTYESYEEQVRNHIAKTIPPDKWKAHKLDAVAGLKDVLLSKLDLQTFQQFLNAKLKAGNSPSQVAYLRTVARIALNYALKADLVARNVAALSTPPRAEKKELEPFTQEQAARLLKAAMGHRLEALFTVGLAVGLRSGECSGLRWADVNLKDATIEVRHTLQRKPGAGLVLVPPKSEKSRRRIELPKMCIKALEMHSEIQRRERIQAGTRWRDTGFVFTSTIGTPIDDRKILKEFNALVTAAKLHKQRFHDLRHACISLLAAQGVPLKVIAEIVGHSDVRLTQNVYQHVYRDAKREAAGKIDAMLSTGGTTAESAVATTVATNQSVEPLNRTVTY